MQLKSDTEYTGNICWFNLVPEQPASIDDDTGVDSFQFNYIKEEDGSVSLSLSRLVHLIARS